MRVGQLTDCYLPVLNGVTNFVRTYKAQLERLGHRAPIFTAGHLDYPDQEPDVLRSWGVRLGDTGYYAAPAYSREAQAQLATLDLLHVHHPYIAGMLALRYGQRFGKPVVYTNHTRLDLYADAYVPSSVVRLTRWLLCWYIRRFVSRCDLVIAPSDGLAEVMRRHWKVRSPLVVVPNGIDLGRFQSATASASRGDLGLPPDGLLAIYTGRLGAEKNLDFLLQGFVSAVPSGEGMHLLLLGDGPQAVKLRALAGKLGLERRVIFAGAVPYEQVPAYLAVADLFVTASVTEVHPLSLIEALAAGLPVLGVISPGVADTVEDDVNGLLTTHDLSVFAAAFRRLVMDADLRSRLAAGARQTSARYSIARTTTRILELYRQLLEQNARMNVDRR